MTRVLIAAKPGFFSEGCRVLLEARGYQPLLGCSAQEGIALILEDPPDLLIVEWDSFGEAFRNIIKVASGSLQKANMPILLAVPESELILQNWDELPVDDILLQPITPEKLLARIMLAEARMRRVFDNNPLSKLPGNTSILKTVQRRLDEKSDYGVCYLDIDNFKPYNDRYGFSQGDDVILMVARLIVNVVGDMARHGSFVGHIGGDDFVFIVRADLVDDVCRKLIMNFNVVRDMFLNAEDLDNGAFIGTDRQGRETRFDLLSISVAVVMVGKGFQFSHFGEVAATATQLKHCVKKRSGSNYMIDRRGRYFRENSSSD